MAVRSFTESFLIGSATGIVFGTAMEKSKVYLPEVIRSQMRFSSFIMLKMFLAATATGMVSLVLVRWYTKKSPAVRPPTALGLGLMKGYGGNIIGGLILGSGMAISGACPGTVYVQLGAGVENAPYTIAGGLAGAAMFAAFESWATKKTRGEFGKRGPSISLENLIADVSAPVLSLAFAGTLIAVISIIETLFPWATDASRILGTHVTSQGLSYSAPVWSPIVSGVLIGLLQVPSFVLMGALLGTSASYVTMVAVASKLFHPSLMDTFPYLKRFQTSADYWQVGIVAGAVFSSFLSARFGNPSTSSLLQASSPVAPLTSFLGGVLLLVGARTAGGCTSGHGLSGMATLSLASILTVASMFAGAIAVTNLFF